ncbi:MAG TPA: HAMP domain-containing sensor histidine kinase [Polyangia bacterium]|nr:HAMP domain-containing sensor histidine kinase [Polyangia bacterium]
MLAESRIGDGTLTGLLANVHAIVDRVSPIVVGAMLGLAAYTLVLRRDLAAAEAAASRSEALRGRLLKVERDQAIWVLAATVLHELNNPLHALGLLLDECAREPSERQRGELIERVRVHADRARQHLAVLRSLRGRTEPNLQQIDLADIVRSLAADLGGIAREDGIEVRAECDAAIMARADGTYVRTILENLVDNSLCALRGAGGGRISVRLRSEQDRAVVSITDDGPPIDDEARDHLFEPLRSTKAQGLGLGLPIARALARAMSGDLTLEAAQGKMFRLELPLHGDRLRAADDAPPSTAGGA